MKNLRVIALGVRKKCEKFALSNASINYDFHNQNDLACMCAVASFVLAEALRKNGIKCNVLYGKFHLPKRNWGSEHCWVEVGRKIVDITATQFQDLPKVYIVSNKSGQYRGGVVQNNYDQFDSWGGQMPTPLVSQKILKCA